MLGLRIREVTWRTAGLLHPSDVYKRQEYNLTLDTTLAVRASIEEIEHTLVEALLLVVLVVFRCV